MAIMTSRGEKTLVELTDNLYGKLTEKQRETVSKALLKANPRLKDPRKVAPGTILIVPEMVDLRPKSNRALENPDVLLAKDLSSALEAFGQHFEARAKQANEDNKGQAALLKSAGMKDALSQAPALRQLAGEIGKSVEERTKDLQARQKSVSAALQLMQKTLG